MSGFISYPRTDWGEDFSLEVEEYFPKSAYAHCPDNLKKKFIKAISTRHFMMLYDLAKKDDKLKKDALTNSYEEWSKMVASGIIDIGNLKYLSPNYPDRKLFGTISRGDEGALLYPEKGAIAGSIPGYQEAYFSSDLQIDGVKNDVAKNFTGEIKAAKDVLTEESILWRFIGAMYTNEGDISLNTCNRLDGEWWGVGPIPSTEEEWRRDYAIPGHWNGDGTYEAIRIGDIPEKQREEIMKSGLVGKACPQESMIEGHYLRGGGIQLWIERGTIDLVKFNNKSIGETLQPSNWNKVK